MDFDFDHVHLVTADVDSMVDYFERVFGAKRVSYNADFKGAPSAVVGLGTMRVLVRGLRPGETPDAVAPGRVQGLDHFGVVVGDVEKAAEWLRGRGAEFSVEPTAGGIGGRMIAFVRGPENIEIEIVGPLVGS
jgi:catechol 2,3-dioxygenase-like lactoylglutathione lyase family enzyme